MSADRTWRRWHEPVDSETWAEPDPAHDEEADLAADREAADRLGWS